MQQASFKPGSRLAINLYEPIIQTNKRCVHGNEFVGSPLSVRAAVSRYMESTRPDGPHGCKLSHLALPPQAVCTEEHPHIIPFQFLLWCDDSTSSCSSSKAAAFATTACLIFVSFLFLCCRAAVLATLLC